MIDAKSLFTAFLTNVLFKESFKLGILYVRSLWASNNKDKMETLVIVWTESCTQQLTQLCVHVQAVFWSQICLEINFYIQVKAPKAQQVYSSSHQSKDKPAVQVFTFQSS